MRRAFGVHDGVRCSVCSTAEYVRFRIECLQYIDRVNTQTPTCARLGNGLTLHWEHNGVNVVRNSPSVDGTTSRTTNGTTNTHAGSDEDTSPRAAAQAVKRPKVYL